MADHEFQTRRVGHGKVGVTVSVRFSLHQFAELFKVRNAYGQPYVLIGGQAVNYWAERYLHLELELREMRPFTSEDIDFKGDRSDVKRIAEQLRLTPRYPPKVEMTALAGFIQFEIGGVQSNIEIVRKIPGVRDSVEALAIEAALAGRKIRVLDPISLFACKLELAARLRQENRRDLEHLRILVPCVRAFLREFLEGVENGALPVKGWLGAINRTLKLSGLPRSRKTCTKIGVDWAAVLPTAEIAASKNPKVIQFREKRLPRWRSR